MKQVLRWLFLVVSERRKSFRHGPRKKIDLEMIAASVTKASGTPR